MARKPVRCGGNAALKEGFPALLWGDSAPEMPGKRERVFELCHRWANFTTLINLSIIHEKKLENGKHLLSEQRKNFSELEAYLQSGEKISVRTLRHIKRMYQLYGDYLESVNELERAEQIELVPVHTDELTLKRYLHLALDIYDALQHFVYGVNMPNKGHKMSRKWVVFFLKHFVCSAYSKESLRRYFRDYTDENVSETGFDGRKIEHEP